MDYDCGIILAHELEKKDNDYELSQMSRERMNVGIYLLEHKRLERLILSGGCENRYEGNTLSGVMKQYALRRGIDNQRIIEEPLSRDTTGELIFSKQGIITPRNWKKILIITHKYHLNRTAKEADFIFGKGFELGYFSVFDTIFYSKKERESLDSFRRTFEGIPEGDNELILKRLLEKHPLYNINPSLFLERLKKLTRENQES